MLGPFGDFFRAHSPKWGVRSTCSYLSPLGLWQKHFSLLKKKCLQIPSVAQIQTLISSMCRRSFRIQYSYHYKKTVPNLRGTSLIYTPRETKVSSFTTIPGAPPLCLPWFASRGLLTSFLELMKIALWTSLYLLIPYYIHCTWFIIT